MRLGQICVIEKEQLAPSIAAIAESNLICFSYFTVFYFMARIVSQDVSYDLPPNAGTKVTYGWGQ